MKAIPPFSDEEYKIIQNLKKELKSKNFTDELKTIENNENSIRELAASISLYPSILGTHHLGSAERSVETLVENLCIHDPSELILNIPTKAILGKGFTIAKINFFFMIGYLLKEIGNFPEFEEQTHNIIFFHIYGIMSEEVFISIVSDKEISYYIRTNASFLLANIWEYRIDYGVQEFAPILQDIWSTRNHIQPNYGTLFGVSELFKLVEESSSKLMNFITSDEMEENQLSALQEFLFGLSFEELILLKERMQSSEQTSISRDYIESIIGRRASYTIEKLDDPRHVFTFFSQRKNNADFRKKALMPGPNKTLEEYLMCYLLIRPHEYYEK